MAAKTQQRVDAWFEKHAADWQEVYEHRSVWALVHQRRLAAALKCVDDLGLAPDAWALEIGCGPGLGALGLAARGFRVVATDTGRSMLGIARSRASLAGATEAVRMAQVDAHAIAFERDTFDLALALGVLPWLHSPAGALREICRVLKPGGHVIVTADNRARLTYFLDPRRNLQLAPMRRVLKQFSRRPVETSTTPHLHHVEEFDCLLGRVGLEKIRGMTVGFGPFTFFGREASPTSIGRYVNDGLQALADRGMPGIRAVGSQYMVVARKQAA